MPLAPYNRRELFLEAIRTRDTSALPDPNNREELFLKDIADQVAAIPTGIPVSVPAELSELLANLPEPHTHTERFYNDIIGALLVATTVTDTTPYITRVTAGGLPVTGIAELKKKLGNTVCVNQLVGSLGSVGVTQNCTKSYDSGTGIATFTPTNYASDNVGVYGIISPIVGHKYVISMQIKIGKAANVRFAIGGDSETKAITAGSYVLFQRIATATTVGSFAFYVECGSAGWSNETFEVKSLWAIDLTLWFGSNDAIPAHLLSHPENWGRYYAGSLDYEPGRLVSADGTTLRSYDGNGNLLDATDTGNELLRSAGTVADEKTPDGTITRRVGVVDLGTVNWVYDAGDTRFYFSGLDYKRPESNAEGNAICSYFVNVKLTNLIDKSICLHSNGYVYAKDSSYTSGAALKTAMSGVYLYYELATPTTEQGTDFNPSYAVETGGTESWLQDQSTGVPQGHETEYKEFTT